MRPTKPPTVAQLAAQGENFAFNANIPLKHWMRAAETLYQEVMVLDDSTDPEADKTNPGQLCAVR